MHDVAHDVRRARAAVAAGEAVLELARVAADGGDRGAAERALRHVGGGRGGDGDGVGGGAAGHGELRHVGGGGG